MSTAADRPRARPSPLREQPVERRMTFGAWVDAVVSGAGALEHMRKREWLAEENRLDAIAAATKPCVDWSARIVRSLEELGRLGPVHGSACRQLMRELGAPGWMSESYTAEKLLELVFEPVHELGPRPTPSQAAWIGLQYGLHPGFVPGTKEHYTWRLRCPKAA